MYEYSATLIRIVDGDTLDVRVDCGFRLYHDMRLRLAGINAPELKAANGDGVDSRKWLSERVPDSPFIIQTVKDRQEKYGRYLATIIVDGVNLNQQMVAEGKAVKYP